MSTQTETILARMMNDPDFADSVFSNPEKSLAEYKLSADEIAKFKSLTQVEFEEMTAEDRKSFGTRSNHSESFLLAS